MSYHGSKRVPLTVLSQMFMFEPGQPNLAPGTTHVRIGKPELDGTVALQQYRGNEYLGRTVAKWAQTAPIAPHMRGQQWWTKTGQWGSMFAPEASIRHPRRARPPSLGALVHLLR